MGKDEIEVSVSSPETSSDRDSPITHILCLKNADDLERFEETEDCFIIDYDPVDLTKLIVSDDKDASELSIIYEKGQVACRDYPHSRHMCSKFPFDSTTHETHCHMCYCYVCDLPAPCSSWFSHCHASDHKYGWKIMRANARRSSIR